MSTEDHEQHAPPHFKIAGFSVWMFARQFDAAEDYWDGNWLRVLAQCGAEGALVRASGAILHLSELQRWLEELKPLHAGLTGSAELTCIEPNFNAKIELKDGRGTLVVDITPDHLSQAAPVRIPGRPVVLAGADFGARTAAQRVSGPRATQRKLAMAGPMQKVKRGDPLAIPAATFSSTQPAISRSASAAPGATPSASCATPASCWSATRAARTASVSTCWASRA